MHRNLTRAVLNIKKSFYIVSNLDFCIMIKRRLHVETWLLICIFGYISVSYTLLFHEFLLYLSCMSASVQFCCCWNGCFKIGSNWYYCWSLQPSQPLRCMQGVCKLASGLMQRLSVLALAPFTGKLLAKPSSCLGCKIVDCAEN